ncbi:MAG: endonuclease/exonuclease/phosphatase family protein [Planctomycetota bacterium]
MPTSARVTFWDRRRLLLAAVLATSAFACGKAGTPGKAAAGPEGLRTLRVLTYNVLADEIAVGTRIPALMKILDESDADVMALQEVDGWFLQHLGAQPWLDRKYGGLSGKMLSPNGQLIVSKWPAEKSFSKALPGRQGRDAAVSVFRVNGRRLAVATSHMESPLEAHEIRASQLDAIFPLLDGADDAIFLGDMNFGNAWEPETSRIDKRFSDLWRVLHPDEPGFTWNMEKSEMARRGSFPNEKSGRIDRIFVRSGRWKPASIRIVGDESIPPGENRIFPSDHFGIAGTLEWVP